MAGNRLGDAGAAALAPALGRLPRLREVFALEGNGLGPAGVEALHAAAAAAAALRRPGRGGLEEEAGEECMLY